MRSVERRISAARQAAATIPFSYNEKLAGDILADKVRHPTAPVEITWQTALYQKDSLARQYARIMVDFPDVTKATDGTDIPIMGYELWGRDDTTNFLDATTDAAPGLAAPGLTIPSLASTPAMIAKASSAQGPMKRLVTSTDSSLRVDSLIPGTIWTFQIRAIGRFTTAPGDFSPTFQVQMDEDTTPPPQPTVPKLTANRGTIKIEWDGMAVTGAMPADFAYLIVAYGDSSSPINDGTRFFRGGGLAVISETDYYTPQFVRFRAVDLSGNLSPWSEQAVAYTQPLVDTDVILSKIDGAKTALSNIDAAASILTGTVLTRHLVITEDMTAALAQFLHVKAGMIEANAVSADSIATGSITATKLQTDLALITNIIAGNPSGEHASMEPTGFKVYGKSPDDGHPYEVVSMGVADSDDLFAITDSTGTKVAQIDVDGVGTFQTVDAKNELYYKGTELQVTLDSMPKGIVNWNQFGVGSVWPTLGSGGGEVGLFEIGWETPETIPRMYAVNVPPILIKSLSGSPGRHGLVMRMTTDGTPPTVANGQVVARSYHSGVPSGDYATGSFNNVLISSKNGPYIRILISLIATVGSSVDGTIMEISVEDMGVQVPTGGSITTGGITPTAGGGTGGVTAPPANPVVTRTLEYSTIANGIRSFLPDDSQYAYNVGKGYQGLSPAGYGNLRSMYCFPSVTGALAGATISDIWVYFYFEHWYANAGGYAKIGLHPNSSVPGTWNTTNTLQVTSPLLPKASGRYVRLPSSTYAGFQSGAWKGATLLGDSSYNSYGIANAAKLKIKYTK